MRGCINFVAAAADVDADAADADDYTDDDNSPGIRGIAAAGDDAA